MARACKCDRCGAFYEPFTDNRKFMIAKGRGYLDDPFSSCVLDICDDCYDGFEEYMKKGAEDERI